MSRIIGRNVNVGNSFVLNSEGKSQLNKEISDAQLIADSIIAEAKKQAEAIVMQARNQAAKTISDAEQQAEASKDEVTAESRRSGYEDGYADGQQKIVSEMEDLIYNINNFAKCRFEMKNRIIKSLHTDILELVLEISRKVCKTEITESKEILTKVVAESISYLKEKENVTIIVHPEMANKLYAISNDLKEIIHNLEHIKIIEDSSVSPDGTIVESVGSRIDARVSAQIEQISQRLFTELNSTSEIELVRELAEEEPEDNVQEISTPQPILEQQFVDNLDDDKLDEI